MNPNFPLLKMRKINFFIGQEFFINFGEVFDFLKNMGKIKEKNTSFRVVFFFFKKKNQTRGPNGFVPNSFSLKYLGKSTKKLSHQPWRKGKFTSKEMVD